MSLFIDQNELIEGEIFYIIRENNAGNKRPLILSTDIEIKRYGDEVKSFKIFFRQENYALSNQIIRDSVITQPDGSVVIHPVIMGEAQLKKLLAKWTLKDEETGEPIPINDQTINRLHPDIARSILVEYRRLNYYSLDEDSDISEFLSEDYDEERLQEILSKKGVKVAKEDIESLEAKDSVKKSKNIKEKEEKIEEAENNDGDDNELKTPTIEE